MGQYKLLPYGISDYAQVKREGNYLVDKTMYLERMEKTGHFLFLIRPRRFGKSLFLSMMESYYDIESKDNFELLFGDTYVRSHPTPERNEYQVLRLDFSKPGGDKDTIEENVNGYLDMMYGDFVSRYAKYYPESYVIEYKQQKSTSDRVNYVHQKFQTYNIKSYLIVDEYDNFTNNVLNQHGEAVYHAMTLPHMSRGRAKPRLLRLLPYARPQALSRHPSFLHHRTEISPDDRHGCRCGKAME